ncbi:MAG: hypothetical protein ACYC6Y_26405 [Thermoguttaceae bacterium]
MIERVEKQRLMAQLRKAGLWEEADQYREEARQRLRAEGKAKQEAVSRAWEEMAEKYEPLVEQSQPPFQTILPPGVSRPADLIDPDYRETDDAAQIRDVYRWIKEEFPRIVEDRPAGTVVDYRLFRTPPPLGLACNILETWAAKPRQKRDGLFREIRQCLGMAAATAPSDSEPEPRSKEPLSEGDLYLMSVGAWDPDE